MRIRWLRLLTATLAAEAVPIAFLIAFVALFGPDDIAGAQDFATRTGSWVGPIVGAIATFLFAVWVGRPLKTGHLLHGTLLGCFVALLDAGLLFAGATEFEWLFVVSGLGRIVAGTLGGLVMSRA